MINELRTRILNEAADFNSNNEELIDPRFNPKKLSSLQGTIYSEIFKGSEISRNYRNFIATSLARTAGSSNVSKLVLESGLIDPRVYFKPGLINKYTITVSGVSGNIGHLFTVDSINFTVDVSLTVDSTIIETTGTFNFLCGGSISKIFNNNFFDAIWKIQGQNSSSINISSTILDPVTQSVSFNQDSSVPLFLPGSGGLFIQWVGTSIVPDGFQATIEVKTPMSYSTLDLLDRLRSRPECSSIFGKSVIGSQLAKIYETPGFPEEQLAAFLFGYALTL